MKKLLISFIIGINILAFSFVAKGQDFHFNSTNEFHSHLSPSLTGAFNGTIKAMAIYRTQWRTLENSFDWQGFNFEARLNKGRDVMLTGGLVIVNNKVFAYNRLDAMIMFSSAIQLNRNSILSAGISAGVINNRIDPSLLTWGSQYDARDGVYNPQLSGEMLSSDPQTVFTDGVGLSYLYRSDDFNSFYNRGFKIEILAGAWNLSRPELVSFTDGYKMSSRFVGGIRSQIALSQRQSVSILPNIIYQQQGNAISVYGYSMLRFMLKERSRYTRHQKGNAFLVNLGLRNFEGLVAGVGVEYSAVMFLINYEANIASNFSSRNIQNTFEVGVRFLNPPPERSNIPFF